MMLTPFAAPDLRKATIEQLVEALHEGSVDSDLYKHAKVMLETRIGECQRKSSSELVRATELLVKVTKWVAIATWGLVGMGALAVIVTLIQVLALPAK
jgi:hypothetical protein